MEPRKVQLLVIDAHDIPKSLLATLIRVKSYRLVKLRLERLETRFRLMIC